MSLQMNTVTDISRRCIGNVSLGGFQRRHHVTMDLVQRIGLEAELQGHQGCVNCLEWNEGGSLLASGSDDLNIKIWDPFHHKKLHSISSGHHGNIFSVKFLPSSNDEMLVSGAADCKIRVHNIHAAETTKAFSCHAGRVKRLATAPNIPNMFWSAAEDGTIMQFDLRDPDSCCSSNPRNVLVNLNAHITSQAEAKCLAINPLRTEQLAVGANDPYVRLYDRRKLSCKSIQFPGGENTSGRSPWERQNLFSVLTSEEEFSLPATAAQYYIAGHLPQKQKDYKKRYRTLASTYLTFSPDGTELLVNLGGEQIYLFDINQSLKPKKFDLPVLTQTNGFHKETAKLSSNGLSIGCNRAASNTNGVTNGLSKHFSNSHCKDSGEKNQKANQAKHKPLPAAVEAIKRRANEIFEKGKYDRAIIMYNKALAMAPMSPVLYGNRAAAFMKRGWDGDLYAALRDCHSAIALDNDHLKAHFRLARCLFELQWPHEAAECLQLFKLKFPEYATSHTCQTLDRDIKAAIFSTTEEDADPSDSNSSPPTRNKRKCSESEQEKEWREGGLDYKLRFCGHCNTTTDIKEANYFGSNGQYIIAGSDDGSFFVWEKSTTNIIRVLRGDDSIVNCLQPHPSYCLLATSGIDPVVRLWSPRPQDGKKDEREVDNADDAASDNQKRMNADPLEVMLMNMGYRITGVLDGEEEEERDRGVPCRPS